MRNNFYVLTNKNHHWLLYGFLYLWNKYTYHREITIVSYGDDSDLAIAKVLEEYPSVSFMSIADENYPANRWSTGLIRFLNMIEDDYFGLLLEDYWLTDNADMDGIDRIDRLPINCLRFDISGNRASYMNSNKACAIKRVDGDPYCILGLGYRTIATYNPTPYQMSFQAAIWNKHELLLALRSEESPWGAEVRGSDRLGNVKFVLGSDPAMMRYVPIWRSRQRRYQIDRLKREDREYIVGQGWLMTGNGIVA